MVASTDAWYRFWDEGRDADAALQEEWFLTTYQGEIDFIADRARTTERRDSAPGGVDTLSCMSNPDPYGCP